MISFYNLLRVMLFFNLIILHTFFPYFILYTRMIVNRLTCLLILSLFINNVYGIAPSCRHGDAPSKRYFHFLVEYYSTMGPSCLACVENNTTECNNFGCVLADGVQRSIITVNRQMPGPVIEVCEGDTVQIDVENKLQGAEISIHWHGILQHKTPYMDGTPFVTQCPITEGTTFRYTFVADKIGTYFWHSHSGMQKMDGFIGAFIVRSANDPTLILHDTDNHLLFLQDWTHELTVGKMPGPLSLHRRGQQANNLLINGLGNYILNENNNNSPLSKLRVKHGMKHRIRIINAGCFECPLQLFIEKHEMSVISVDGSPVQPVTVDSIIVLPGERVDVVLTANAQPDTYWIIVRALADCEDSFIYQRALLVYEDSNKIIPSTLDPGYNAYETKMILNPMEAKCGPGEGGICTYQLKSLNSESFIPQQIDSTIRLKFNFYAYNFDDIFTNDGEKIRHIPFYIPRDGDDKTYELQAGQINNISMVMPKAPILSQPNEYSKVIQCNKNITTHQNCYNYEKITLNSTVDILFLHDSDDEQGEAHPMHIHGYRFYVLYQGYNLTDAESSNIKNLNPVLKDTVNVPGSGMARIRLYADNPGYWLLHCHIIHHQLTGMSLMLRVGKRRHLPPIPINFPQCGNFIPE